MQQNLRLSVGLGNPLELILLLDGIGVRGSLSGIDELVGQAFGNAPDVSERSLPGSSAEQPNGLVDPPQWGDIYGLTSDGTGSTDTGGVFPRSTVDDGIDNYLEGVLQKRLKMYHKIQ